MTHLNVKIYGRVQGVLFRHSARKEADKLDINGFARNDPDGSVYIEAEGEKENLEKFLAWCQTGPEIAKVEKVDFEFGKTLKNFTDFTYH